MSAMAEEEPTSEEQLRAEFHTQTAKISWQDLQPHYARGAIVMVARSWTWLRSLYNYEWITRRSSSCGWTRLS